MEFILFQLKFDWKKAFYLLLISISSVASDIDYLCENQPGVIAASDCIAKKQEFEERNLRASISSLLTSLENEQEYQKTQGFSIDLVRSFSKAQSEWEQYRDSHCIFEGLISTSTAWQGIQIEECRLRETKKRIEYIEANYRY